ncbi:MAG TPA: aminotransferase class IV [Kofleriaceae bacterium]|jgi:branched-chain amino acid aminotransferase
MIAVSIDGELVAPEAATISIFDRGLLYGDGLFEVLRTWRGVAVDLDRHLDRLYASAQALELRVMPRARLAAAARATVAAAGDGEHRIRIIVTRGPGALSARLGELGPGRAIAIVEPLATRPRELSAVTIAGAIASGHKTLAYLDHLLAREQARAAGADEAIRIDARGCISEGATSNVFVVVGGAVATPPLGAILPGVTRGHVLARCAELAIPAFERPISRGELAAADELFVTSALRGVVPITRLDGVPRAAGPISARLAAAYDEYFEPR